MRRACALVLFTASAAAVARGQPPMPAWEFKPDVDKRVFVRQPNGLVYHGRLNIAGTFIPERFGYIVLGGGGANHIPPEPWGINDPKHDNEVVYEYRGGVLVHGKLSYPGNFTPTLGKAAAWIDDYRPVVDGKPAPRIYNLPGTLEPVPPSRPRVAFAGLPKYRLMADWTRDGKMPARLPEATHRLDFQPDRLVGLVREKAIYVGRLTQRGDFVPALDIPAVPYRDAGTATIRRPDRTAVTVPVINHPAADMEFVFELRGDVLVAGQLREDGGFEASSFSTTISFADYLWQRWHARPESWRIYNLPGRLVPIPER